MSARAAARTAQFAALTSVGYDYGQNKSSNNAYSVSFKEVTWYVPELRNFIAKEYEQRNRGQIEFFTRDELTSYSVRGANP